MMSALLLGVGLLLAAPAAGGTAPPDAAVAPSPSPLPTPQFRRYGTAEGLPSSLVYTATQAPDGSMWFGTRGGLAHFDGVDFRVYRHVAGDPRSLHHDNISSLLFDAGGRLWVAGLDAGLNRFDPDTGTFDHWEHDPADPRSLASSKVWALARDADGGLWIGTHHGLDRMDRGGHFEHIVIPALGPDPGDLGEVAALYVDARQRLWISTGHGVFRRDGKGGFQPVRPADPSQSMDAWRIDGDADEIRIATDHGLLRVDPDGLARRIAPDVLPDGNVMASVRDHAGRLWIGTQRGLFLQEHRDDPLIRVLDRPVLDGNLPGTWVWGLSVDREGGLWVSLVDGGVGYLAPGWYGFSRYTHVPDDPASLRDSVATTMARGQDGRHVWVGERGGRVDRLDPRTGAVEHVLSGLHGDVVGMTEDRRDRLWVAVQGALYRTGRGRVERIDPAARFFKHPLEVEPGPDGRMFVRTFGEGLFQVDPDTLEVARVPTQGGEGALWGAQMTLSDRDGTFWYASEGGLLRLDPVHGRFETVPGAPTGISVRAFALAADGIWLATPDGLEHYRYRGDGLVLERRVGAAQGWPPMGVVDLREDARGRIWIFSGSGLWRFDPGTGRFRAFGLQDGLSNGEFARGYALMPDGALYAGTLGGVVGFVPEQVCEQTVVPPLVLTGVRVRRQGVLRRMVPGAGPLQLGWRDRELGVEARVFSYVDPSANRYRFRLRGFDAGWVDVDNRGMRDFAGLDPGDYTLQVMGAGADGTWAGLSHPLAIHVQAPPWSRWWARAAYVAVLALAVWLVFWIWRRRLAQQHRMQLTEQQRCLAEEASAAKTRFLATLSHEIRTPMTGVLGMAELLQTTSLGSGQRQYVQAIQRSGTMLLKLLNDALDLARIEAGRIELEPAPFDLPQLLGDVAHLQDGLARIKGLVLELELAADLPSRVVGDAVRIKQVLLNLTHNAIKFTDQGRVGLAARRGGDGVVFTVRDSGPGIPDASQARLFQRFEQIEGPQRRDGSGLGLAICRELVALMGGSIELESQLGKGSAFHVRLPLAEPEQAPAAPAVGETSAGARLRILLVEDDPIVGAVIRGLLERQQHQVTYVTHGLAALAELAAAPFDGVLLDLDLPGVDGFQVARLARQREQGASRVPIVAITARSGGDEEARAREAGMDAFLRKPFDGEQLAVVLAGVLARPAAACAPT